MTQTATNPIPTSVYVASRPDLIEHIHCLQAHLDQARHGERLALAALGKLSVRTDAKAMWDWAEQGGPDPWRRTEEEWAELGRAYLERALSKS